ncbi:MAG: PilC/PilY family type IV pilus protein [Deltaproteobacteria bacterium]|nr:PilC/PilY family type IV pilus protein [Deltaproteobacteria bacterium]
MIPLIAIALAAPLSVLADDTELFSTRANPNVLLMLDTTGSMSSVDPGVAGVGDLDGNGTSNTRMDILWKVVYSLLNADLSIPSSTASYSTTVRSGFSAGYQTRIRVNSTNWSSFPSSGTIQVGSGGSVDTVTYTSKSVSSGRYYFNFSPAANFVYSHPRNDRVSYSSGSGYTTPYPTNHTEAIGTDYGTNVTADDEGELKARIGLMTFTTNSSGTSVQINVRNQIGSSSPNASPFASPTRYSEVWEGVTNYAYASGGTPTAQALNASQTFFTAAYDTTTPCRKNFAILITDGEDTMGLPGYGNGYGPNYYPGGTFNSDGSPTGNNPGQVTRNNQVIQAAADLKTQGYELFAVGVGISGNQAHLRVLREVLRRAAEQAGVTGTTAEFNAIGASGDNTARADGKAFFATDATELATALTNIFKQITLGTYSFTSPTVLSVRTVDRNELYLASFQPTTPPATFWPGSLKAHTINADNSVTYRWDAATALQSRSPATREIFTSRFDNSSLVWSREQFKTNTISPADLDVPDTATRDAVVNYIRGASHDNNMKLGDIFHSKPVLVGGPSAFHVDEGYSSAMPSGGISFLEKKKYRRHMIYAGANDGMLHAFQAGDYNPTTGLFTLNDTGEEVFGYIPNSLLTALSIAVPSDATSHCYHVDSAPRVADVWWDKDSRDGVKQSVEWHTVLVAGLRRGGEAYFALDVTDPGSGVTTGYPAVLWEYNDASVLGETWSEPYIGKVKIQETSTSAVIDRYVAIAGGGKSDSGTIGNSLLVFDIENGTVLKRFSGISAEIVASPSAVLDSMGYIRFIYVPDINGNLWKFDFRTTGTNYGGTPLSEWTEHKIFQPIAGGQQAFNRVEAADVSSSGNTRYLYFGTGDRENPISNGSSGKFYCIKDTDSFTGLIDESVSGHLADLTGSITSAGGGTMGTYGWKVVLGNIASTTNDSSTHVGEKVLSDPLVFYNRVYFTTYTPNSVDPCSGGGIARVYGLNYLTAGAGMEPIAALGETGTNVPTHVYTDKGMPSSPALSINPGGQSSVFIGFSDGSYQEIAIESPPKSKFIRSWQEQF